MINQSARVQGLSKLTAVGGMLLCLSTTALAPREAHSEALWEPLDIDNNSLREPKAASSLIWNEEPKYERNKRLMHPLVWEVITDKEEAYPSLNRLVWEVITDDKISPEPPREDSKEPFDQQLTPEQVEAILNNIPLKASDYLPLLRLSPAVPTANILQTEELHLRLETLSPFESTTGTGNQNYAINLDLGITENVSMSGFASRADDPLNATLKDFEIQPANFWESYGLAARWKLLNNEKLSFALNGSIETWKVGSGGSDSFNNQGGSNESPNIFNDSGKRVETTNLVGSLSFPFSWKANQKLNFIFSPGVSWLPATQGAGQGGSGTFLWDECFYQWWC